MSRSFQLIIKDIVKPRLSIGPNKMVLKVPIKCTQNEINQYISYANKICSMVNEDVVMRGSFGKLGICLRCRDGNIAGYSFMYRELSDDGASTEDAFLSALYRSLIDTYDKRIVAVKRINSQIFVILETWKDKTYWRLDRNGITKLKKEPDEFKSEKTSVNKPVVSERERQIQYARSLASCEL